MRQTRVLAPLQGVVVRDSGDADSAYTINAKASVFDQWSVPLGWSGFLEKVAPGAFARVLSESPHVTSNWLHDDRWQLGSTTNGTLTLREVEDGLEYWTRVARTSYAADLRVLLERRDVAQCSFCFTIERETWVKEEPEDGSLQFYSTIEEIGELYDVTVCPAGAYPQTEGISLNSLASTRDRFEEALRDGRVPDMTIDEARERGLLPADGLRSGVTPSTTREGGEGIAPTTDTDSAGGGAQGLNLAHMRAEVETARARIPK